MALQVYREPHLRRRLRARPVPDGTAELLAVAGGSAGPRLARLADACGAEAAELLEAARFFIREVLLHPDADAYRVLGVEADASAATIKTNYRRLQRWLHPDRQGDGPESIYSRRVNAAWASLRTPASRQAYDQARAGQPAPGRPPQVETDAAPAYPQRWQRVAAHGRWMARPQALVPLALLVLCGGLLLLAARESPLPTLPEPLALYQADVPVQPVTSQEPAIERIVERAAGAGRKPQRKVAVVANDPAPLPAAPGPEPSLRPEAPDSSQTIAVLSPVQQQQESVEHAVAGLAPVPAPVPVVPAPVPEVAPLRPDGSARDPQPPAAQAAPVAVAVQAADIPALPPVLEHARSARTKGDELLAYITRKRGNTPPPIWHGAAALDSAECIRTELTGGSLLRRPRVDIDQAHWILGADEARLQVPVTAADRTVGTRILHVGLRWKNDEWWIESVTVEVAR